MLKELVDGDLSNVVLTSACWSREIVAKEEAKERQLIETPGFWGDLLIGMRLSLDMTIPRSRLSISMAKQSTALETQVELDKPGATLLDTAAGKTINKEILEAQEKEAQNWRDILEAQKKERDVELHAQLEAKDFKGEFLAPIRES